MVAPCVKSLPIRSPFSGLPGLEQGAVEQKKMEVGSNDECIFGKTYLFVKKLVALQADNA